MKFCKSEKTLYQINNFTPPPNYYHNNCSQKIKVNTGSLAGPSFAKQKASFGLSQRFGKKVLEGPGPGSYTQTQERKNIREETIKEKISTYKKASIANRGDHSPSIPYKFYGEKADDEDNNYIRQLLMNEDVNKSALNLKRKEHAFTFSKSQRKSSHFKQAKQVEYKQEKQPSILSKIRQLQKQEPKRNKFVQIDEKVKKANERRNQIINLINPEFIPSLQLIQIMSKRRTKYVPGPGYYQNASQLSHEQREKGVSFTSAKRFESEKNTSLGPGEYAIRQQKNKRGLSFNRSDRNLFDMKNQIDIEHRFYIDPNTDNFKPKTLMNSEKQITTPFGSNIARFKIESKEQMVQSIFEEKTKKSIIFKKAVAKRLKKMNAKQMQKNGDEGLLGISTMASTID